MTTETFEQALQAVATRSPSPPFELGQLIWAKNEWDHNSYVVIGLSVALFNQWKVDAVLSHHLSGHTYTAPATYFTDKQPTLPKTHDDHPGNVYYTKNGNPLKCIRNPLDQP